MKIDVRSDRSVIEVSPDLLIEINHGGDSILVYTRDFIRDERQDTWHFHHIWQGRVKTQTAGLEGDVDIFKK